MHVRLRLVRQVVIDDVRNGFDVNAPRGDVGRDQDPRAERLEVLKHRWRFDWLLLP